jgi:hypothetical protein
MTCRETPPKETAKIEKIYVFTYNSAAKKCEKKVEDKSKHIQKFVFQVHHVSADFPAILGSHSMTCCISFVGAVRKSATLPHPWPE